MKQRRRRSRNTPSVENVLPTGRTIAALFSILLATVGLYVLARESSLFAIDRVTVEGAPPALSREIRSAVQPYRGRSLVTLNRAAVERAVLAIPDVRSVRIDRDFPNSLRIFVKRERPLAVLRRGDEAWLIAMSGKAVRRLTPHSAMRLPRVWLQRSVSITDGELVSDEGVQVALRALAPLARIGHDLSIASVLVTADELTLVTRSGLELRLGDASQASLKLAVASGILPTLVPPVAGSLVYLDVSVPERPVSGTTLKSKVEGKS
jgi:cell division protein FtsQ